MTDTARQTSKWLDFANPARFVALAGRLLPWFWAVTIALLAAGLWLSYTSPEDYQQGVTVDIMYIHVPFAWLAMMCYTIMTLSALGTLVSRHPLADVSAKAAAPIGATFTALALVTGSIWGKPMWGTWWVWDARLTSMFVLFLIYLGIIALSRAIDEPGKAGRAAAIVTLVGFVNIPIIKFSVDWWNTLHQGESIFRADGPTIAPVFLWPLGIMTLAFTALFFTLHLMAIRNEIWRRRVATMRRLSARSADRVVPGQERAEGS